MERTRSLLAIATTLLLLLVSCAGGDDGNGLETASTPSATAVPTTVPTTTTSSTTAAPGTPTTESIPEPTPEPTAERRSYTVQPGDSLAAIAEQHGVPLADLIAANRIADPNQITVGQELIIPAPGEVFEPPPPPEPTPGQSEQAAEAPTQPQDQAPAPEPPPPAPPPPPPPPPPAAGGDIYFNHCSGCHGDSGQGASGPALGGGAVVAKYPNAADQIAVVTNGQAAMPAYGGIISPAEIEAVVYFTRSL